MINKALFLFSFCLVFIVHEGLAKERDSLLQALSTTIEERESYIQIKEAHIKELKQELKGVGENDLSFTFSLYRELYDEYRSYQFDSAFTYVLKLQETAYKLEDKEKIMASKLFLGVILRSSGMFKEAFDSLETVNAGIFSDSLKIAYYGEMALAYYVLSAYDNERFYTEINGKLGDKYLDSAISLSDTSSLAYFKLKGMEAEARGEYTSAKTYFNTILDRFDIDRHQVAMANYSLGKISLALGNEEESLEYIIKAAIADVQSVTKETVALMDLAKTLYDQGEVGLAYDFINQAADDAFFYGARHRILQVSAILPEIEAAKLASVEYQRKQLLTFSIVVTLLSLLVIGFAIIIFRQYRMLNQAKDKLTLTNAKLQLVNENLTEANAIKEEYIGHSFSKDSEYLNKLDRFKKDLDRKLISKKYEDLHYVMKSVDLKKEREALYIKFDEVFLKLFPNFLKEFNSYFNEGDHIEIKEDGSLPIELRIFALIRLGILDHEQIANILGYSVRTIYNYKTKIKSKSLVSNDEFEKKIMEIKAF